MKQLQHALIKTLRKLTERIEKEYPPVMRTKHLNEALKLTTKVLDSVSK